MADAETRMLKIKTGSVQRLKKELKLYEKEKVAEEARVQRLKAAEADVHDIRQAENVLAEAVMIIPDTRQRLEAALQDLTNFVGTLPTDTKGDELLGATECIKEAQEVLQQEPPADGEPNGV